MKLHMAVPVATAGLLFTVLVCANVSQAQNRSDQSNPFVSVVTDRSFTVSGRVVSTRGGSLVVRIDDHGHRIPFSLGSGVSTSDLRVGSRVNVRYHASGATGQVADEIQVVARR